MINVKVTNLENIANYHRTQRDIYKKDLLEACKEGRFEDVPKLTVKWQEQEDELRMARERFHKERTK